MRKTLLTLVGCLFSFIAYSQVPFVTYEAVPNPQSNIPINSNSSQVKTYEYQRDTRQQAKFQIVAGYHYDNYSQNFKRIKIRVNAINVYGQPQVYLRGVYNAQYDRWSNCNQQAAKVNSTFDEEVIVNNFEWKAGGQFHE